MSRNTTGPDFHDGERILVASGKSAGFVAPSFICALSAAHFLWNRSYISEQELLFTIGATALLCLFLVWRTRHYPLTILTVEHLVLPNGAAIKLSEITSLRHQNWLGAVKLVVGPDERKLVLHNLLDHKTLYDVLRKQIA